MLVDVESQRGGPLCSRVVVLSSKVAVGSDWLLQSLAHGRAGALLQGLLIFLLK